MIRFEITLLKSDVSGAAGVDHPACLITPDISGNVDRFVRRYSYIRYINNIYVLRGYVIPVVLSLQCLCNSFSHLAFTLCSVLAFRLSSLLLPLLLIAVAVGVTVVATARCRGKAR